MGQAKKLMMEFEENVYKLDKIVSILSLDIFDNLHDGQIINDIYAIQQMISNDPMSMSVMDSVSRLFSENLQELYSRFVEFGDSVEFEDSLSPSEKKEFENLTRLLWTEIRTMRSLLRKYISEKQNIYNSEDFYNQQIKELQEQRNQLEEYLRNIEGQTNDKIAFHKKEIQEKERELQFANEQIHNYQKELEDKKKQENVITEWNIKIKDTFSELTEYLSPITTEHRRLTILFWSYLSLIGFAIVFIVIFESIICVKISNEIEFPKWKDYIASIIPVPVIGALLWAFISQLNRTQRQLIILAKHIHEIRYVEGLLLSLNSLSPNINDSIRRVNIAIDKLLNNHLSESSNSGKISEEDIVKEEKKDMIPYDLVIKLLKEVKGIVEK